MQLLQQKLKQTVTFLLYGALLSSSLSALAASSDMEMKEKLLQARAQHHQEKMDHSQHIPIDKNKDFHGVFYGYLPCADCNGIKTTLSLKQNNLYLLVTQYARDSSRELYEKGKYTWDDEKRVLVLTPRKDGAIKQYRIDDEGTIVQLNSNGTPMPKDMEDEYTLKRSDMVKGREVHIH
ncbi:hypothetical protein JCM14076_07470 [Methylosoma difficile]